MRLKWDGSFEVYRIVARGVRLRGRLVHGKVSWGQIDKLLPPPSNKPFQLPEFRARRRRQQHRAGDAVRPGRRRARRATAQLSGGFKGRVGGRQPAPGPRPLRGR